MKVERGWCKERKKRERYVLESETITDHPTKPPLRKGSMACKPSVIPKTNLMIMNEA